MNKIITIFVLFIAVILGCIIWWKNNISPANPNDNKSMIFVIEKGTGLKEISSNLSEAKLIKSRIVFFLYTRLHRYEGKIQAGDFRLNPSMSVEQIAQNLTHGTLDMWVTIPEGQRATEIAETLQETIPTYNQSWKGALILNEGYLFPDTYLISKDANIETIVKQLKENFEQKYSGIDTSKSTLTKRDIIILASLIEREAITDEEKPIIAGILMNRLNIGMALQVDATIQYAKGQNLVTKKWWGPIDIQEYRSVTSSYNTYLQPGFPPGPISNPGLEALKAAANPADTDYLYYIHDKNGQIRYAKTLEEHNANIEKYGTN
jgi:UPF0755 protein